MRRVFYTSATAPLQTIISSCFSSPASKFLLPSSRDANLDCIRFPNGDINVALINGDLRSMNAFMADWNEDSLNAIVMV